MTPEKIAKIKQYQRDYVNRFHEKLEIDWEAMAGVPKVAPSLEELFRIVVEEHGASEDKIRSKERRLDCKGYEKEKAAIKDFCKRVFNYKLDPGSASKLINRDRAMIYHYAFKKV